MATDEASGGQSDSAINQAVRSNERRGIELRHSALACAIDNFRGRDAGVIISAAKAFAHFLDPSTQKAPDAPK